MKAFFDSSMREGMSKERWGGAKWFRNQLRVGCDNKYERGLEPDLPEGDVGSAPSSAFYSMVRVAWHKDATAADCEALMKRTHIVLNTKKAVYYRPAGVSDQAVKYIRYPGGVMDFLTDSCKPAVSGWAVLGAPGTRRRGRQYACRKSALKRPRAHNQMCIDLAA